MLNPKVFSLQYVLWAAWVLVQIDHSHVKLVL